jgi:CHAT domain-containing protein
LRQAGRQLYDELLRPVADRLPPNGGIVIEPDGALAEIPFPALIDEQGRYFGDRFDIVISPGLLYHSRLRHAPGVRREQSALVIGNPLPSVEGGNAALPVLPEAEAEAAEVARSFSGALLLTGRAATAAHVRAGLPDADVVHYAGHFQAALAGTGLLLSPEPGAGPAAPFGAADFHAAKMSRCRLVVLSACSSVRGDENGLYDASSLARSLLADGVPTVVASRWDVDSLTAAAFMRHFYRQLLSGESAAQSSREAARLVRASRDKSHPYHWAAFGVFGR